MRNLLLAVLLPSLVICLSACSSSGQRSAETVASPQEALPATAVSGDEWLAEAALAKGSRAADLYLNAAQAYLLEQRFDALGAVLATIELPPGRPALNDRYARLRAAWHLSGGDVKTARQWLNSAPPPLRDSSARRSAAAPDQDAADDYWLLAAAIGEAGGDWSATASALAQVEDAVRYYRSPWFTRQQSESASMEMALPGFDRDPAPPAQPDNLLAPAPQAFEQPPAGAASAEVAADSVAAARQQLHDHLWLALNRTQRSAAKAAAGVAAPRERAWWTLRLDVAAALTLDERRAVMGRWQRQHGGHPATRPWPRALALLAQSTAEQQQPLEVALLLPLSGPLSAAGEAIRDGFIATQLEAELPLVARFYDVGSAPLPQLLETATVSADVIIGPVAKEQVSEIARLRPERPTLALNYLDTDTRSGADTSTGRMTAEQDMAPTAQPLTAQPLADPAATAAEPTPYARQAAEPAAALPFQLGIAIEDEARTLVEQLQRSGVERLLVIHGTANWARRAASTIAAVWTDYLLMEQFESVKTITESIGTGMLIDDSHRRAQQLRQTIGEHIEFTPRARQDLDAIVALVSPVEAEALRPALRFHFADRIPVFSTSQLLRSRDIRDQPGLSGIQLTELPGLLNTEDQAQRFNDAFGLSESPLAGLYTLGADAALLAPHLPLLQRQPAFAFDGSTGALTLAADGRRLQRELGWAVLSQGRARPAPSVQAEAPAAAAATGARTDSNNASGP